MSHFSRIKTRLQDLDIIQKALADLHFSVQIGTNLPIRGYNGQMYHADLTIQLTNGYDIGLKKNPKTDNYDVVADWYGIKQKPEEFMNQLQQRYAYHKVVLEAERRGLLISEDTKLTDGSIRLVVRQWA
jgi:Protein of unknown function (DUF1257)